MKSFLDIKITKQLVFFLVLLIVFPVLGLGASCFFQKQVVEQEALENLSYLANINKGRISEVLRDSFRGFEYLQDNTDFQSSLALYLDEKKEENLLNIIDQFEFAHRFSDDIQGFFLFDSGGELLVSFDELSEATSFDFEDILFDQTTQARLQLQGIGSEDISALISGPVKINEDYSAIMAVALNWSSVSSFYENYRTLSKTGEMILVGWDDLNNLELITPPRFGDLAKAQIDLSDQLSSIIQASLKEEGLVRTIDYRGERVFAAIRYFPDYNWAMVLKIDQAEVFSPLYSLLYSIALVAILIILLGAALVLYSYYYITEPLNNLTSTAEKIKKGKYDFDFKETSKNEIGVLAKTIKRMTTALTQANQDLEEKVKNRTRALRRNVTQIKREKAKSDAIISSIGEGMIVTDAGGVVVFVNQIIEEIFFRKEEDFLGKKYSEAFLIKDIKGKTISKERDPVSLALSSGKVFKPTEFVASRDEKEIFPVVITSTPIFLGSKISGSVVIIRDITKEKEISKMKSEFISIASHQLRAPISSIKWYGELLAKKDTRMGKDNKEYVRRINISTKQLISLVDDFLNVSRIESGKIVNDPKKVCPVELVKNVFSVYEKEINEKEVRIRGKNEMIRKSIMIDPEMIREVFTNLISNAIKYSKEKGLVSYRLFEKGNMVVFEITDSGDGIPQNEQDKVFSKFFRASNIVKQGYKGTGLGLYTSQKLASHLGGKIGFVSEQGKGSTFWVELPKKFK